MIQGACIPLCWPSCHCRIWLRKRKELGESTKSPHSPLEWLMSLAALDVKMQIALYIIWYVSLREETANSCWHLAMKVNFTSHLCARCLSLRTLPPWEELDKCLKTLLQAGNFFSPDKESKLSLSIISSRSGETDPKRQLLSFVHKLLI